MQFVYRTEPYRAPLLIAAGLVLVAVFAPLLLFRMILLAMAAGPGAWALIQWRRHGRGVQMGEEGVLIQPSLIGRARLIPYHAIQNFMLTPKGQLVLAYQKPEKVSPVQITSPQALTDIRPESHRSGPRYGLSVTPALDNYGSLAEALSAHLAPDAERHFTVDDLKAWRNRRRLRNAIFILLAVLATPVYIIVIGRIIASFLSIGIYGR